MTRRRRPTSLADPPVAITTLIRQGFAAVAAGLPDRPTERGGMTVTDVDVVIAGAGPNGLMLACELALAGVRSVVLDKLPGPSDEPKANGLVGQVIRQLDMRGLYHAFGGRRRPPQPTYGWMFAGMPLNFLGIEDNPMYALLIQQPRLVRLLEKRARDLGVDIRQI